MSRGSDVGEGALPQRTVLFKVAAGSTLKAAPVVEGPRVMSSSSRRGGFRGGVVGDRGGLGDRVGLSLDGLSRCCRKDR